MIISFRLVVNVCVLGWRGEGTSQAAVGQNHQTERENIKTGPPTLETAGEDVVKPKEEEETNREAPVAVVLAPRRRCVLQPGRERVPVRRQSWSKSEQQLL